MNSRFRIVRPKFLMAAITLAALSACVNPFQATYRGVSDARTLSGYEAPAAPVKLIRAQDYDAEVMAYIRKGFELIGESSFNAISDAVQVSDFALTEQADRVGAHFVLAEIAHSHSVRGAVPLSMPITTTSQSTTSGTAYNRGGSANYTGTSSTTTQGTQTVIVPFQRQYNSIRVGYFVKRKVRLGTAVITLSDDIRRRIQTNVGVGVATVVEGSPAFFADVLSGDIILEINGQKPYSAEQFNAIVDSISNEAIALKIRRGDADVEKTIHIPASGIAPLPVSGNVNSAGK